MIRILLILATLYIGYTIYMRIYAKSCPSCGQHMKKDVETCPNCKRLLNSDAPIEATVLDADVKPQSASGTLFKSPLVLTLIVLTLLATVATAFLVHVVGQS